MRVSSLAPLPLSPEKWNQLAQALRLSPQQKRIVELLLQNRCDKQIAVDMGLAHSTLRTYISRIFHRTGVSDRVELILLIFALSHDIRPQK